MLFRSKQHFEAQGETCYIVDNYVEELEPKINLALGFLATYIGNMHVALERAGLERAAADNYDHVITCGTIFENASYTAQSFETDYAFISNDEERQNFIVRSEAAMRTFACFYLDLIEYDHVFHLSPLTPSENDQLEALERNLQSAFEAFKLVEYNPLFLSGESNQEIVNNRLLEVLKVINANQTEGQNVQVEESDGSGVRSGSENGEEQATA